MKKICLFLISITTVAQLFAQTTDTLSIAASPELLQKKNFYQTKIKMMDGSTEMGWLANINESELIIYPASKQEMKGWRKPDFKLKKSFSVPAEHINIITMQKKNAKLKGTLIGLGIGVLTGVISGFASGNDPVYTAPVNDPFTGFFVALNNAFAMTAGEKALSAALVFGTGGALAGFLISSVVKKKFIIGGKKENFRDLETHLMQRLIIQ